MAERIEGVLGTFAEVDAAVEAIEKLRKSGLRRITAFTHGFNDIQHSLIDRVIGHAFPAQQMIQMMGEIRVSSVESANCSRCGHSESLIGMAKTQVPEATIDPLGHLRILAMRRIDGAAMGHAGRSAAVS